MDYIKLGLIVILIDYFYLSWINKKFNKMIVKIQGSDIELNYKAAAFCYALLIFCLKHYVIEKKFNTLDTFLLGVIIYGVFDTTNGAIFNNWDLKTILLDTIWGGILFSSTTFFYKKLFIK